MRPTDDVDVVVAATTRTAYHNLGECLRGLGFSEDTRPGAPLCRWRAADDVVLDVMPMSGEILGFTNCWYRAAMETAVLHELEPALAIRITTAPVFLATKWAAFDSRGGGDHFGSHDLEDIISVVAGRAELTAEIAVGPADVREFLAARTREFLKHPDAGDSLAGALPDARFDPGLIGRVRGRLLEISSG